MPKAFAWTWFVFVVTAYVLMVGLYSRVVYTLWSKPNDDNELTYQQKVCVNEIFPSFVLVVCTMGTFFSWKCPY